MSRFLGKVSEEKLDDLTAQRIERITKYTKIKATQDRTNANEENCVKSLTGIQLK